MVIRNGIFRPVGTPVVTRFIRDLSEIKSFGLHGTILDPALENNNGFVVLPKGTHMYEPYVNALIGPQDWVKAGTIASRLKRKKFTPDDYLTVTDGLTGIMLPKGINRVLESTIPYLTDLQAVVNRMVDYCNRYTNTLLWQMTLQKSVFDYSSTLMNMLIGKGKLIDHATGCIHPVSGRAVISCNPMTSIGDVVLPEIMVRTWLHNEEFRKAYNLSGDTSIDLRLLEGRLVLVSRHPTHDRGSMVALRLRTHKLPVIGINPVLIAAIWQGDFDGDAVCVSMPIKRYGINDIEKMKIDVLLKDYSFLKICKELRFFRDEKVPDSVAGCDQLFRRLNTESTNGASLGYMDVLGLNENSVLRTVLDETSYNKLINISNGLSEDDVIPDVIENFNGYRTTSAVTGYRTIKGAVAKLHGAMNSAIALCTAMFKGTPDFRPKLLHLATLKRILAGQGLAAKHGTDNRSIDDRGDKIQQIFYNPVDSGWIDREQVHKFFVEDCGLPAPEVDTLLDVVWSDPPVNINERLRSIAPFYMMTRRGASSKLFDTSGEHTTITEEFLYEEDTSKSRF